MKIAEIKELTIRNSKCASAKCDRKYSICAFSSRAVGSRGPICSALCGATLHALKPFLRRSALRQHPGNFEASSTPREEECAMSEITDSPASGA